MELTPVQTLAGWIVFCQRSGDQGAMYPPQEILEEIVKRRAGRYVEAEALAAHFLSRVSDLPANTVQETAASGMKFFSGLNKHLGSFFSTPPVARPASSGNGKSEK